MIYDDERTPEQFSYPYINLNGASRESLLKDRMKAKKAIGIAIDEVRKCWPHGRDYQTAPHGAFDAAHNKYTKYLNTLQSIENELRKEAMFIFGQTFP